MPAWRAGFAVCGPIHCLLPGIVQAPSQWVWVYLEYRPSELNHFMRTESSLQRFYRSSYLVLRNESKMVRIALWASFWTPHVSQPECCYNMHKGMCTNITPCQEVSFSRTALNSINHQGPENMYLQGSGSADDPPFPSHKWINTVWYRLQLPWHPRRTVSAGTHWVSFCPSYRFDPNMCAGRWAGWLKNFQKYTWCPKSINHRVTLPTAANSTPSFLPVTSCSANHWADHRKPKVACDNCPPPASRLFREGKGEAEITPVGPAAGLPAVHKALTSARGHGRCPTVATEGQSQSHLYRGCFVQSVFDLTRQGLVGWSGPDGQGLEPN